MVCPAYLKLSLIYHHQVCTFMPTSIMLLVIWKPPAILEAVDPPVLYIGAATRAPSPPPPPSIDSFDAVIRMQESSPQNIFLVGCSSPFMRLAEYLTAFRAWC